MINRAVLDQVEEAIDCFEENWSPESREQIDALLETHDLTDDVTVLTELIRIDIELRYKHDVPVQLEEYFAEFGKLLDLPGCVAQIAFEDFRSRSAVGQAVAVSRWEHLPGIRSEIWFQQLAGERSFSFNGHRIEKQRAALDLDPALEAELESAGFQLVREIGQGARSRVYLATQNELADRHVVLKVVDQPLAEPESMAMLQHTNIVPIYSFHRMLSRSVICMPYAGSVTLRQFLKNESRRDARSGESLVVTVRNRVNDATIVGGDPEPDLMRKPAALIPAADERAVLKPLDQLRSLDCNALAVWMFQRLASALAHSHARGVLHGDLKPGNVLIRNDGEPALLDFNLSQSLDRQTPQFAGGTLPYMSPESYHALMCVEVIPHGASDIYSLGVMLFEFVTGRLPFVVPKSASPIDLPSAIDARKGNPDWRDDDVVSPGLRAIIIRCLEYAPENRYASANQLQQDLECERQDLPLANAIEPRRNRVRKWTRRHPRLISSGSVGLALIALMIPIGFAAVGWRNQSLDATALEKFNSFANESAAVLTTMMADPQRHQEPSVVAAIKPLQDYGILDGTGLSQFESPRLSDEQRALQRDTLLRHVAQVAFAETNRLRPEFKQGTLGEHQLQRLDRLIAAADAIRGDDVSRACLFLKADRARMAGQTGKYETLLEQAREIDVTSDTDLYLEAVRWMAERRWRQAMELLTLLADRNSIPSTLRWTMLAGSQYNAGEYEDAKLSITQSIERAPHASRLWFMRGLCYYALKQYSYAEDDFTRTLEFEPTSGPAWYNRGRCRSAQGRIEEGIADFTNGLEHAPGDVNILLSRSTAYRKLGMTAEADRDFADAMKADKLSSRSLLFRAKALMDLDPEQAVDDLRRAHVLDPVSINILTRTARILSTRLDRPTEAIEVLNQATEIDPDYETAIIDRAVLFAQLGRYEEARKDLDRAMEIPNFARSYYQAACVCALMPDKQDHIRSLSYLSQAIRAGYQADQLATDPDLASVREMDGFRAIQRAYQLSKLKLPRRKSAGNGGQ